MCFIDETKLFSVEKNLDTNLESLLFSEKLRSSINSEIHFVNTLIPNIITLRTYSISNKKKTYLAYCRIICMPSR